MQGTTDVRTPPDRLTDEQARTLEERGYVVVPGVLTPEECDVFSATTDEIWVRQRSYARDYVEAKNVQFTTNLLRESPLFERCVIEPVVLDGARSMMGPDVKLYLINGRRSDPGGGMQALHDLERRRGRPFEKCTVFWCLDAFTLANGATRVIPGSHLDDAPFLPKIRNAMLPHPDQVQIVAPRGAIIIFNAALIHAGSLNMSVSPRRSIQSTFCLPSEPSHYDWTTIPEEILRGYSPETLALLGLDAPPV